METVIKKLDWNNLKHEYGVDGQRLLPWDASSTNPFPFGGAYCVCKAFTSSLEHINDPSDEDELFIVISGKAKVVIDNEPTEISKGDVVYISAGKSHYVDNSYDEDFHFYALWWNSQTIEQIKK